MCMRHEQIHLKGGWAQRESRKRIRSMTEWERGMYIYNTTICPTETTGDPIGSMPKEIDRVREKGTAKRGVDFSKPSFSEFEKKSGMNSGLGKGKTN